MWEQLSLFTWPINSLQCLYITVYIWQLREPSQVSTWIGDCQKIPELAGRNTEKKKCIKKNCSVLFPRILHGYVHEISEFKLNSGVLLFYLRNIKKTPTAAI